MIEGIADPITIAGAAVLLVSLWFLLRFALQLTAVLLRLGCLVLFVLAMGAALWYFLRLAG